MPLDLEANNWQDEEMLRTIVDMRNIIIMLRENIDQNVPSNVRLVKTASKLLHRIDGYNGTDDTYIAELKQLR